MPAGIESRATLPWLVRLRWLTIASQLLALVLYDRELGTAIPWAIVAPIVGVAMFSNLALTGWIRRHTHASHAAKLTAAVLTFDTLLLTGLLAASGGPANPFTIFYIVHIVLAALVLETRSTVWITILSALGFAALFLIPQGPEHDHSGHAGHHADPDPLLTGHLRGMWIAFAVAAAVIAYFVRKISLTIAEQREQIALLRERDVSRARLASLAALSAGAAHELGTPLGTIAVAARELELALQRGAFPPQTVADAQLITAEVERCRVIIGGMAAETSIVDARVATVAPQQLFAAILRRFDIDSAARVQCNASPLDLEFACQLEGVARAAATLVKNALDASTGADGLVEIELVADEARVTLTVRDTGKGLGVEELARAGEPFFTTKQPGEGMGLGLFIARTYTESLGGLLELRRRQPRGTEAILTLPRVAVEGSTPA
ncbi:MAG: HAMP domain-containing histidine kinase [Deltaproteobacteria bacterium]|nr:HAMP domain-containing histidine kinase [Nannocystaceae bacterium]